MLAAAGLAVLSLCWGVGGVVRPAAVAVRPTRASAPLSSAETAQSVFELSVDLGEGGGVVEGELTAFFTHSELVTVRYPVPLILQVSPAKGVVRVDEDGMGLRVGDVLRACSTLLMRYDSEARAVKMGTGFHGRKGRRKRAYKHEIASRSGTRWWERHLSSIVPTSLPELGVFTETCPTKVLFIADGQPYSKVHAPRLCARRT
eukprot:scaffold39538_cov31-Tisochrysis_lutea.AAC.4